MEEWKKDNEEIITDNILICHGCLDKCKITIKDQNVFFDKKCALDHVEEWE